MNRFALSHTLPVLGALAFAAACTDATSPNPHAALRPRAPTPTVEGNVPPPPTRTVVSITVSSPDPVTGIFTGVYFSNGANLEAIRAAEEVGDLELPFSGTAWLRLDNTQEFGVDASANARFQRTDRKLSGTGTLKIGDVTIQIVEVLEFDAFLCSTPGEPCAFIRFRATRSDDPSDTFGPHIGRAYAFNRELCTFSEEDDLPPCVIPDEGGGSGPS